MKCETEDPHEPTDEDVVSVLEMHDAICEALDGTALADRADRMTALILAISGYILELAGDDKHHRRGAELAGRHIMDFVTDPSKSAKIKQIWRH